MQLTFDPNSDEDAFESSQRATLGDLTALFGMLLGCHRYQCPPTSARQPSE